MTRLTEATETFAWARGIDWSEGAVAMRSGEEHLKRRKARYLKRREDERKCRVLSIKKKSNVRGAGSRFCQKYAKLSFSGGEMSKEKERDIFFSTKAIRAQGLFDHTGFTGRRKMTPFGVRLSRKEAQTNVNIEINEANTELIPVLEAGGFAQQSTSSSTASKLCFEGSTQYLLALLPTLELVIKEKCGKICTSDFFLLENFFPRIQGILDAPIEAISVGTSVRAQAWERFRKPDKDAKVIRPNIFPNTGKPRPNCVLINRDTGVIKSDKLSPLRRARGSHAYSCNDLRIGTNKKVNKQHSNGKSGKSHFKLSRLPQIKSTPGASRSQKKSPSELIADNEGLQGRQLSPTDMKNKPAALRTTQRRTAKHIPPTFGRGASNSPLISPYIVRNLPSIDVKALRGSPCSPVKFGHEIDPVDGFMYESIPKWSP